MIMVERRNGYRALLALLQARQVALVGAVWNRVI